MPKNGWKEPIRDVIQTVEHGLVAHRGGRSDDHQRSREDLLSCGHSYRYVAAHPQQKPPRRRHCAQCLYDSWETP